MQLCRKAGRIWLMVFAMGFPILLPAPTQGAGLAKKAAVTPSVKPQVSHSLDQERIHAIYNEGDFDHVVALIDSFTAVRKSYSREDSIFIAKHLAVVYSANPATREKGKGYMFRMLDLMPSAKIVDMFVSDEIDRVFEKVKEEYVARQRYLGRKETPASESTRYAADRMSVGAAPATSVGTAGKPADGAARDEAKPDRKIYWLAGGAAVLAVAGVAFYLMQPEPAEDKVYGLPSN